MTAGRVCMSIENGEGLKRMGDLREQRKWGTCLWCVKPQRDGKGFERTCQWEAQELDVWQMTGQLGEVVMRKRCVSSMSTRLRLGYGSFPTASLEPGREGGSSGRAGWNLV